MIVTQTTTGVGTTNSSAIIAEAVARAIEDVLVSLSDAHPAAPLDTSVTAPVIASVTTTP